MIVWPRFQLPRIGYGWVLDYRKKTSSVYIKTRLLKGPAGRAGIPIGAKLINFNGIKMNFGTRDEFIEAWKRIRPTKVSDCCHGRISMPDGSSKEFSMVAQIIWRRIPVYDGVISPNDETGNTKQQFGICKRTGAWIFTTREAPAVLDRIFG